MNEVYTDHEHLPPKISGCPEPTMERLLALKEIDDKRKEEEATEYRRKFLAISLNICPVCGCQIIDKPVELFNPPKKYFFGLITRYSYTWDHRKVCSSDESHYEYKYDNDNDDGGYY